MKKRLGEIDALRGIAILLMVVYHFAFNLVFLDFAEWNLFAGGWLFLARLVQFLFLGLVGVSIYLSGRSFLGQLKRGAVIFALGMLVTIATYVFFPEYYVRFGILHLIGVSVPIVVLFKGRPWLAFWMAVMAYFVGMFFETLYSGGVWLLPLGIKFEGFASFDYFPIFPWIGVVFIGLVVGELFYKDRKSRIFFLNDRPLLSFFGRHALIIYLIHQPVLYGLLSLM